MVANRRPTFWQCSDAWMIMSTDFLTVSCSSRTLDALLDDEAFTYIGSKAFTLPKSPLLFLLFITPRSNYYYEIICILPMYINSLSNVTIVKAMLLRFVYATALGFGSFGELAGLCGVSSLISLLSNCCPMTRFSCVSSFTHGPLCLSFPLLFPWWMLPLGF